MWGHQLANVSHLPLSDYAQRLAAGVLAPEGASCAARLMPAYHEHSSTLDVAPAFGSPSFKHRSKHLEDAKESVMATSSAAIPAVVVGSADTPPPSSHADAAPASACPIADHHLRLGVPRDRRPLPVVRVYCFILPA